MEMIFNTTFEVSMRILLLLSNTKKNLNEDEIAYLDFITIYSNTYGFGNENLNGNCVFPLNEFTIQRKLIKEAIKDLVINSYVQVINDKNKGFTYSITDTGYALTSQMQSDYSKEYQAIQRLIIEEIGDISMAILKKISKRKGW